jgi:tetratricopeptide (TPR) repeat protein
MNSGEAERRDEIAKGGSPLQQGTKSCAVCGIPIKAESGATLCPVCLLRSSLDPENAEADPENDPTVAESAPTVEEASPRRFGHYEIATRSDGALHELGHGAMGITFKAIDLNLRIPVTLKVLNMQFFREDSARRRFFREARVAATVRHPNVASVYHLGMRGREMFYAMEFVNGETLEGLIKRTGCLEPKLALEIVSQVAAGLEAIHMQNLVHRDIKPTNIMVRQDGRGALAKIIDLGLAKAVDQPDSGTAISVPGSFTGTPAFASPEQFAGVGVDIRSDLYSLGVTLWVMLTGAPPFGGTPSEVMHKHQYAPLPRERLGAMPTAVVELLAKLLEKDPSLRFQSPDELAKAIRTIITALGSGGTPEPARTQQTATGQVRTSGGAHLTLYELYQRGMAFIELLDRDANQKAIGIFKSAIERDSNFALGYAGLARAYFEEEGFGGEKSLLDSVVQLCRVAIALDPMEVRGYEQLGRAYFRKGWYPQCDDALRKALELAPNDERVNGLAALREMTRHHFTEAYAFFRKAYALNPNEPRLLYAAAGVLYRAELSDVADKWMEQALQRETNPLRHRMMECYRMMWRRKYSSARAGFAMLPRDLKGYDYSVSEGMLYSTVGMKDWPAVAQWCRNHLAANPEKIWPRTYLALALEMSGQQSGAQQIAEEIVKYGLERLERPAAHDIPWEVQLYVAWAYRLLNSEEEAYRHLNEYLAQRTLLHVPLGVENPIFDVFRSDSGFEALVADLNNKFEVVRRSIRMDER